ncbi:MAG: fibronectin type III domain-containing protein, partial [Halobacteria archaeon]
MASVALADPANGTWTTNLERHYVAVKPVAPPPAFLEVTIEQAPANATRNATLDLNASVRNIGSQNATSAWLNWTLPANWTVVSGSLNVSIGTLGVQSRAVNNLTVRIELNATPGARTVAAEGRSDQSARSAEGTVNLSAQPALAFEANRTEAVRGDFIRATGNLTYDNGTALSGQNLTFINASTAFASNTTNASGFADGEWNTSGAELGTWTLNVTYAGNSSLHTLAASNNSVAVTLRGNTSVAEVELNNTAPVQGQAVRLDARLLHDNGTALSGQTVAFDFNGTSIGSNATNSTGWATAVWDTTAVPAGNYVINASFPGNGSRFLLASSNNSRTATVSAAGQPVLSVTIPASGNVTRNQIGFAFNSTVENIGGANATNTSLNWSLPANWTNATGSLNVSVGDLAPSSRAHNNLTVSVDVNASLGPQEVRSYGNSTETTDNESATVTVFAETSMARVEPNSTDVNAGAIVRIEARLLYDNGTALAGQRVNFTNNSVAIGNNSTNTTGWAVVEWSTAGTSGTQALNASFAGNGSLYVLASFNNSRTVLVRTAPAIASFQNNKTNDTSANITVNESEAVRFNATANQPVTLWRWFVNGTNQSQNFDNITLYWPVNTTQGIPNAVTVNATNENGTSQTVQWNVTVNDVTPPSAVQNLANGTVTHQSVPLSWGANPEADVAGYSIYRNGTFLVNVTATTYTATGLSPGTDYQFNVSAFDDNFLSGPNASLTVRTKILITNVERHYIRIRPVAAPAPVLDANILQSPNVTRGSSADFNSSVRNNGNDLAVNTWLNWTLPSGWTNASGPLNTTLGTLGIGDAGFNNITASVGLGAALGPQSVQARGRCDAPSCDNTEGRTVHVFAPTAVERLEANATGVDRLSGVLVEARLVYDNGTGVAGAVVQFFNNSTSIGNNTTNSTGWAGLLWNTSTVLGDYTLNASHAANSTALFTLASFNNSRNVTVFVNTSVEETANATEVVRGAAVFIEGLLLYDNGSAFGGQNVTFANNSSTIATATTNATGYANATWSTTTAPPGIYTLNTSYGGNSSSFIKASHNNSRTVTVRASTSVAEVLLNATSVLRNDSVLVEARLLYDNSS